MKRIKDKFESEYAMIEYIEKDGIVHSLDMYASAKKEFIKYFEENVLIPKGLNYKRVLYYY